MRERAEPKLRRRSLLVLRRRSLFVLILVQRAHVRVFL